jgi:hypothetical protein
MSSFHDDVLGALAWDEEEGGWVARPPGLSFRIIVGGPDEPDPALLVAARLLVAYSTKLVAQVASLLEQDADRLPEVASEIRALQMDAVHLMWPARPSDGMIYFSGPDPYHLWRCDYTAGVAHNLVFDD